MLNKSTIQTQVNRSLAFATDAHLRSFYSQIEVLETCVKFKDYAYVDYDVVGGGAIFFFVPFNSFMNKNWDGKDTLEVFIEFPDQQLFKEAYSPELGVHKSHEFKFINNDHEKFNLSTALMGAEFKAFKYISEK